MLRRRRHIPLRAALALALCCTVACGSGARAAGDPGLSLTDAAGADVTGASMRRISMPMALGRTAVAAAIRPAEFAAVAARAGLDQSELQDMMAADEDLAFDTRARAVLYACPAFASEHDHAAAAGGGGGNGGGNDGVGGAAAAQAAAAARPAAAVPQLPPLAAVQKALGRGGVNMTAARVQGFAPRASTEPGRADPLDLGSAFKLHSRPGAPVTILLDFDGHTVSNTLWEGGRAFTMPPYSMDTDPAFSDVELRNIISVWRGVAEDYAAWEVDVTTEDSGQSQAGTGARIVVGGTSCFMDGTPGPDCKWGGIAYVGGFGRPSMNTGFVFSWTLGKGNPKSVTEAASHETGHLCGLRHDGLTTPAPGDNQTEYYRGHGRWAPIMGVGYKREVTQWSKGEYPNANNHQDDLQIIARTLGAPRADDHGNTPAAATALVPYSPAGNASTAPTGGRLLAAAAGAIETTGDVDWFTFAAGAGDAVVTVSLVPDAPYRDLVYNRANVDLKLAVHGPSPGNVVTSLDPQGALLEGSFLVTLPAAGRYWVSLTGVGDGGAAAGYTSYASLGEYALSVDAPAPPGGGNAGGGDPAGELRVKLVEYSGQRNARGWVRVARAKLLVTDGAGAPVPGAAVSARWVNAITNAAPPSSGGAPGSSGAAFKPTLKTYKTSKAGRGGAGGGEAVLASPYAPAPGIFLRVLEVLPPKGSAVALNRGASDDFVQFTWAP